MYDVKRDGDAVSVLGLERLGLLNIPTYQYLDHMSVLVYFPILQSLL